MTKFYQSPTIVLGLTLFLALVIGTIYRINTAIVTHPGLVTDDPYLAGKNYAKVRADNNKLKELGFSLILKKHNFIEINKDFTYVISLNKNEQMVTDAKIKVFFYRPLEKKHDFEKTTIFNGKNYIVNTKILQKGKWRIVVEAKFDGNTLNIFDKIYVN